MPQKLNQGQQWQKAIDDAEQQAIGGATPWFLQAQQGIQSAGQMARQFNPVQGAIDAADNAVTGAGRAYLNNPLLQDALGPVVNPMLNQMYSDRPKQPQDFASGRATWPDILGLQGGANNPAAELLKPPPDSGTATQGTDQFTQGFPSSFGEGQTATAFAMMTNPFLAAYPNLNPGQNNSGFGQYYSDPNLSPYTPWFAYGGNGSVDPNMQVNPGETYQIQPYTPPPQMTGTGYEPSVPAAYGTNQPGLGYGLSPYAGQPYEAYGPSGYNYNPSTGYEIVGSPTANYGGGSSGNLGGYGSYGPIAGGYGTGSLWGTGGGAWSETGTWGNGGGSYA